MPVATPSRHPSQPAVGPASPVPQSHDRADECGPAHHGGRGEVCFCNCGPVLLYLQAAAGRHPLHPQPQPHHGLSWPGAPEHRNPLKAAPLESCMFSVMSLTPVLTSSVFRPATHPSSGWLTSKRTLGSPVCPQPGTCFACSSAVCRASQLALYGYYAATAAGLRALSPPLALMTSQEAQLSGSYRSAHQVRWQ